MGEMNWDPISLARKGFLSLRQVGNEGKGGREMKFVKIIYHSLFNEAILDTMKKLNTHEYVDCQRICAEDEEGKNFGNRYWPETDCILSAPMSDEKSEELFKEILQFKQADTRRRHIRILILTLRTALASEIKKGMLSRKDRQVWR